MPDPSTTNSTGSELRPEGTVVLVSALFMAWIRRPGQRARFDHLVLAIPFVGPTARKFATSQLARTLGTLVRNGVQMLAGVQYERIDDAGLHISVGGERRRHEDRRDPRCA